MEELMKAVKAADLKITKEQLRQYLSNAGIDEADAGTVINEIVEDLRSAGPGNGVKAIAPAAGSVPAQAIAQGKPGLAKQAIAGAISRRDTVVANLLNKAQDKADSLSEAELEKLVDLLGHQMHEGDIAAATGVVGFLSQTYGSSQWLLNGVEGVLDAELIE